MRKAHRQAAQLREQNIELMWSDRLDQITRDHTEGQYTTFAQLDGELGQQVKLLLIAQAKDGTIPASEMNAVYAQVNAYDRQVSRSRYGLGDIVMERADEH